MSILAGFAAADGSNIFTLTNDATGNSIVSFARHADGNLELKHTYSTRGLGTGLGLGSQSAISVSKDGKYIVVVNAGSNTVSMFKSKDDDLEFLGVYPSGGVDPISVTQRGRCVYVLNAGDSSHANNVQEFVRFDEELFLIPEGNSNLSGPAVSPAQVSFTPGGDGLIVTEKGTNLIDSISLDWLGRPVLLTSFPSTGKTPYGFSFGPADTLFVSEAFGGIANASAVSSYKIGRDLSLFTVSQSVPTFQTAACWSATSPDGRFVYVSNTGSGNVTGYAVIDRQGDIIELNPKGVSGTVGGMAIDSTFDTTGRFFYVLSAGTHTITEFGFRNDGSLVKVGAITGIPAGAAGLASN